MSLGWPVALLLLLALPVVVGAYRWSLRRRRKQAVRYSSVALLRSVLPPTSRWRRHLPIAMLLTSIAVLSVASARPQMMRSVPIGRTSIILALDVSRSMCATDVEPNRLAVAQQAARAFVKDQAKGTRTGLVVFSGFAQLVVPPTTDRVALINAIDSLTTARGTAIGAAILKGLDAIADVNPNVSPVGNVPTTPGLAIEGADAGRAVPDPDPDPGSVGAGGFVPDIVVLLTDGANTRGIEPLEAVPYAVERRVRVYTIGFGTVEPAALVCSSEQLGADIEDGGFNGRGFGGGGFGGRSPLRADEPTLQQVAEQTGGAYYGAVDAAQLRKVFSDLPKDVATQEERREITAVFAAIGALLAAIAIAASVRWSPYP